MASSLLPCGQIIALYALLFGRVLPMSRHRMVFFSARLTEHQRMSDSLEDGLDHGDAVLLQIAHLVAKHFTEPGA